MDQPRYTEEEITAFRAMKRDDIYALLVSIAPESAKGKSRAKKDELVTILEGLKVPAEAPSKGLEPGELAITHAYPPKGNYRPVILTDYETTKPYPSMELSPVEVRSSQSTERAVVVPTGQSAQPEGRRTIVQSKLSGLSMEQLELLAKYSRIPDGNRMMRRMKSSLGRRIVRFLPSDVALYEAAAVV